MIDDDEVWWINELFGGTKSISNASKKQKIDEADCRIQLIQSLIRSGCLDDLWIDTEEIDDGLPRRKGRTCKIKQSCSTLDEPNPGLVFCNLSAKALLSN